MNLVDSCGWLSYFADDANAEFFASAIEATDSLLVPGIVVYEVSRRLFVLYGQDSVDRGIKFLKLGKFITADFSVYEQAAIAARLHKLHLADAIIWQTAQSHGAKLYTQDIALKELPGVVYQAKA